MLLFFTCMPTALRAIRREDPDLKLLPKYDTRFVVVVSVLLLLRCCLVLLVILVFGRYAILKSFAQFI